MTEVSWTMVDADDVFPISHVDCLTLSHISYYSFSASYTYLCAPSYLSSTDAFAAEKRRKKREYLQGIKRDRFSFVGVLEDESDRD